MVKMEKATKKNENTEVVTMPTNEPNLIKPAFLPDDGFCSSNILKSEFFDRGHGSETFYSIFNGMMNFESDMFETDPVNIATMINANKGVMETRRDMLRSVFDGRFRFLIMNAYSNFSEMCNRISYNILEKRHTDNPEIDKLYPNDFENAAKVIFSISAEAMGRFNYWFRGISLTEIFDGKYIESSTGNVSDHIFVDMATKAAVAMYNNWYSNYFLKLREIGIGDQYIGAYTDVMVIMRDTINYVINYVYSEAMSVYYRASFPSITPVENPCYPKMRFDDDYEY